MIVQTATELAPLIWFALSGFVLPLLVDLVTRKLASSKVKSLTLLALTTLATSITTVSTTGLFDWKVFLTGFVVTFISAAASLFGITKPGGLSGSEGLIAKLVPGGIGTPGVKVLSTEVASVSDLTKSVEAQK